ncbi:6,7-dimethyl-8-ribityllumazine synthase [Pseudolabrys taiwanensis]|uniref:6,7-dimethyl-8-ribityllumazine synthase n=1 Tax=Pseudolabrys taiwanensis TaxID=331696 RepID=A0A345ZTJ5_9HYPH|nr:6,7-dimethyl-8-ribityllumazine synthase [Pseudolabrys taiwanensis]AXK80242.1 6,7-dimethyl-8-ribityllumazine synthase [Pseudolabrys taiwanensis]
MAKARRKTAPVTKSAEKPAKREAPPHIVVVEARYYDNFADMLLEGAKRVLDEAGATYDVVTVPGALEVPGAIAIAVDAAAAKKAPYDGAVALGCVVQGETYHFEIVSNESARGLMDLTIQRKLPVGNGILTVDTEAQAHARLGGAQGHKGEDAARAALAVVRLKRDLGSK